jgi:hypothetical protein
MFSVTSVEKSEEARFLPAGAIPAIPPPGPLFHPLVPLHCGQRDQVGVKQRFSIKKLWSAPFGDTFTVHVTSTSKLPSPGVQPTDT